MIKGGISKRCPLFYTHKGGRALRARGKQRRRRCTNATPIFFPEKENGRRPSKRKAFRLAVSGLKGPLASGMEVPARGVAALGVARRFDLLLSSAAALPILRKCRLISVYHQFHQCGERSNAAFGTQSAARLPSLAPHGSKARLKVVTTRRRFMAKPCTPHLHCAARAVFQE